MQPARAQNQPYDLIAGWQLVQLACSEPCQKLPGVRREAAPTAFKGSHPGPQKGNKSSYSGSRLADHRGPKRGAGKATPENPSKGQFPGGEIPAGDNRETGHDLGSPPTCKYEVVGLVLSARGLHGG